MLFVVRPSLRVGWPWTPPVLWHLLPQSEAGSILVWYVGRRIVCMLLYLCDVVSVCWHLWFWSHSSGPYMMILEYRLSHALPYTSIWCTQCFWIAHSWLPYRFSLTLIWIVVYFLFFLVCCCLFGLLCQILLRMSHISTPFSSEYVRCVVRV